MSAVKPLEHGSIYNAFYDAKKELSLPKKNTKAYQYNYAALDKILEQVTPILDKHRIFSHWDSDSIIIDGEVKAIEVWSVFHHVESNTHLKLAKVTLGLPPQKDHSKGAQNTGALFTYASRYSFLLALGLCASADVDGLLVPNTEVQHEKQNPAQSKQPEQAKETVYQKTKKAENKKITALVNRVEVKNYPLSCEDKHTTSYDNLTDWYRGWKRYLDDLTKPNGPQNTKDEELQAEWLDYWERMRKHWTHNMLILEEMQDKLKSEAVGKWLINTAVKRQWMEINEKTGVWEDAIPF